MNTQLTKNLLILLLLSATFNAHSDAIKYRTASGQTLITNQPADDGSRALSVHPAEHVPTQYQRAAQQDLERQKAYLRGREQETRTTTTTYATAPAATGKGMTEVQPCLMQVTATFGLSPAQQASRKVSCYSGTSGLNDDCQRSVAATMRISTNEETFYKRQCPR